MTTTVVPPLDEKPWPTLGPGVCDFIEAYLVHGPGDIRGRPAIVDAETRGLIYRAYELYPKTHPLAGRRRFKTVAWSLRKGTAKTEKAAWVVACELHSEGPVRCDGWRRQGSVWVPVGAPVRDPYIPMVAYTEEQTEELAYGALYVILSEGPLADDFDIGLDRIKQISGEGKAVPLAAAPDSRDGARTTFQHFDETHRMTTPRLREARQTMEGNIPKRKAADAWSLETTTAPELGANSVAEGTMRYAEDVLDGKIRDPRLFFFHREASASHDLRKPAGLKAAVLEASGPSAAAYSDIHSICALWDDPRNDKAYLERVWLNRARGGANKAFDAKQWHDTIVEGERPDSGTLVTLGFDGSRTKDATALIGTVVDSGWQWVVKIWERPLNARPGWAIPEDDVHLTLELVMHDLNVWRLYADPPYWESAVAVWQGKWGDEKVQEWHTRRRTPMSWAIKAYRNAIADKSLSHDDDPVFEKHVTNAYKLLLPEKDDQGDRLFLIQKERPDSLDKIDAAAAGVLSWAARMDAVAAGVLEESESVYETRGMVIL